MNSTTYKVRPRPGIDELKKFFTENKFSSFRYYLTRPYEISISFLTYYGVFLGEEMVGYGHLDPDAAVSGKNWVGVCVSPFHNRKGLGGLLVATILEFSKVNGIDNIFLSVDKNNYNAIKLYERNKFEIIEDNSNLFIMKYKGD